MLFVCHYPHTYVTIVLNFFVIKIDPFLVLRQNLKKKKKKKQMTLIISILCKGLSGNL